MAYKLLCALFLIGTLTFLVSGHGFIEDPAARNVCWRKFPKCTAKNWTPDELNCGAVSTQWDKNKGKCGVCGDAYHLKLQPNVHPGSFAKGVITSEYRQGQEITVKLRITTNHKGWSEFRIGDIGSPPITQAKLVHLMKQPNGKTRWIHGTEKGLYTIKLRLPPGLTCSHCVIQWWWKVGNSWGCDNEGCGMGHGKQETFVNCADVKIHPSDGTLPTDGPPPPTFPPSPPPPPTDTPTHRPPPPPTQNPGGCRAIGPWAGNAGMDQWCKSNCSVGNCPASICVCS